MGLFAKRGHGSTWFSDTANAVLGGKTSSASNSTAVPQARAALIT
jgi:hypothetical protein